MAVHLPLVHLSGIRPRLPSGPWLGHCRGRPATVCHKRITPDATGPIRDHRLRSGGVALRRGHQQAGTGGGRRHRPHAGDFRSRPGGRPRLSQPPVHHDRHRGRGDPDHPLPDAGAPRRDRLHHRRGAVGRGGLCRHERLGARQCPHRPGGQAGACRRPRPGLQGRRRDRNAGGRPRPARRRRLLLRAARQHGHRQRRGIAPRARGDGGAGLRRLADLDLRPVGRRHLHQGRRCRRRPGRQGRGRHPRGRPPQPRRDRRQRGRQRGRLRRHGRRPVRDLRRDHRRHHAAGGDLLHRRGARPRC